MKVGRREVFGKTRGVCRLESWFLKGAGVCGVWKILVRYK